jgi:hypothetical protein
MTKCPVGWNGWNRYCSNPLSLASRTRKFHNVLFVLRNVKRESLLVTICDRYSFHPPPVRSNLPTFQPRSNPLAHPRESINGTGFVTRFAWPPYPDSDEGKAS